MSLTLSKHECTVWSPGYASYFTPDDVSLTLDESFSPHIRASLTVPSRMFTEALDPRAGGRLTVRLHQAFGDLLEVNDITSFGGGSVAAWTAKYAGVVTVRTNRVENPVPTTLDTETLWVCLNRGLGSGDSTVSGGYFIDTVSAPGNSAAYTCRVGAATVNELNIPVTENLTYTASLYVTSSVDDARAIAIDWYNASGTYLGNSTNGVRVSLPANTEKRLSVTGVAPPTAVGASVAVYLGSSGPSAIIRPAGATLKLRRALMEQTDQVRAYFDGSTTGALNVSNKWDGAPNASTSKQYSGDLVNLQEITLEYTRPWNLFEPGLKLSTITSAYAGDLSQWTAAGFGSMSTLSKFLHAQGAFNPQPSTYIEANLGIRSIRRDLVAGTTKIDLASDEALLQDAAHISATPYVPTTTDVRTLVAYVLGKIGATLQAGTATGTFTDAEWTPGQSAWDFIAPITQKAGLYLYCDENRKWHLVPNASTSGTLELKDDSNVTTLTTTLERKNNYFDSCVIEYVWTNSLGETERVWDVYAPSGSTRTQLVKLTETPYPGAGMAQKLTERAITRGETFDVEAISNYFARPKQVITVDVTGEPLKTAIVQSIDWRQPADRMTVRIRDLEEVI